jgi:hypothetical protein
VAGWGGGEGNKAARIAAASGLDLEFQRTMR